MDYAEIKATAKKLKCHVPDLIALCVDNDPFYIGKPSDVKLGNWFKSIWEKFGYIDNVHLRRIHYRAVSEAETVRLPGGKHYINTDQCWKRIARASRYARVLKLVDPDLFVDRRNPKPIINMFEADTDPAVYTDNPFEMGFALPEFPELPYYTVTGYEADQRYHCEVWAEKSTMSDILEPLCEKYEVNLITGLGHLSITSVRWLFNRLEEHQKPCRIFYISDFDPAGLSMPVAVARKIEFYTKENWFDIKLVPLILTYEQCCEYELPRTPIKMSDRRATKFEGIYGAGATELDALEALHPGKLEEIVTAAIMKYRDTSLRSRVQEVEDNVQDDLDEIRDDILLEHRDTLERYENEYNTLRNEFEKKFNGLSKRVENVYHDTQIEMNEALSTMRLPEVPEACEAEEDSGTLYDSNRGYFEQLEKYKQFQNGK